MSATDQTGRERERSRRRSDQDPAWLPEEWGTADDAADLLARRIGTGTGVTRLG